MQLLGPHLRSPGRAHMWGAHLNPPPSRVGCVQGDRGRRGQLWPPQVLLHTQRRRRRLRYNERSSVSA